MACKMKKRNMNQGGVVNTLTQVLPTIGMVGQIGSAALGVVNMINENNLRKRQEATDAYMGTTNQYMGYQMGGAVDNPLSNTSVEVQGNPGIDTNPRMVANNAINVTEGEVINNNVNMGMGNSAFVFSNDRSMKDPVNGKTFAKSVKKYEKAKGRAEKRLEKYPFDNEAKNSIMFNQQMIDNTAQRQEEVKSMIGLDNDLPAFGMQYGGKVNYNKGGMIKRADGSYSKRGLWDNIRANAGSGKEPTQEMLEQERKIKNKRYGGKVDYMMGGKVNYVDGGVPGSSNTESPDMYVDNTGLPFMTKRLMDANRTLAGNIPEAKLQKVSALETKMDGLSSKMGVTEKNPGFSTLGDYVYMAGKTAELIGKAAMARQPVRTYNVSDYQLAKPVYNPAMEQRMISDMVRSQTSQINTGNANLDRALASTMYTQGMNKSAEIAEKYRQLQATSDIGVNKANIDAALTIADRNEQNQAARFNAMDTVLSSIGTYGQAVQDMTNTRATNRITMNAINQMAQMYKISPENLLNIMRNNPAIRQQLEQLVTVR